VKIAHPLDDQQIESKARGAVRDDATPDTTIIPVMQEELDVRTRRIETDSGVRISKTVERRDEVIDEAITKEEVDVERVPMNVPIEEPLGVRYEGDTMIIPILEEVLVVEKRLMLKEELRVTRRKTSLHAPQRVTLRREQALVERIEDSRAHPQQQHRTAAVPESESLLEDRRREQEQLRGTLSPPTRHD
jgi:uncharacterized protein (TIGR02271 family)